MEWLTFQIGDTCWLHNGGQGGNPLVHGTIVHIFERYGEPQYVVEIDTSVDPILEVRNGATLSDSSNKPIGMWRRTEEDRARLRLIREQIDRMSSR